MALGKTDIGAIQNFTAKTISGRPKIANDNARHESEFRERID
jgi:hypothetical protein